MLEAARPVHSSATRPMVKVGSMAVRRLTSLHGQNGPAPDAVDHVLAQIIRKRVDLASTVSNEVNVVGAVQAARTPGHEDHLHDVGDSQVIAAHDLNIPKRRPPGLPYFAAMHETFAPAHLVAHPVTGGDLGIRGATAMLSRQCCGLRMSRAIRIIIARSRWWPLAYSAARGSGMSC